VQDLAGPRPGGDERVVAAHPGVAAGGALLEGAFGLAEEAVDVDRQASGAGAGARCPGTLDRLREHPVELAHVAEGEGAQEGAQGGGRHRLVAEQRLAGPAAQHVCVVDRVGAGDDRVD